MRKLLLLALCLGFLVSAGDTPLQADPVLTKVRVLENVKTFSTYHKSSHRWGPEDVAWGISTAIGNLDTKVNLWLIQERTRIKVVHRTTNLVVTQDRKGRQSLVFTVTIFYEESHPLASQ